jgi:hypothetical protein
VETQLTAAALVGDPRQATPELIRTAGGGDAEDEGQLGPGCPCRLSGCAPASGTWGGVRLGCECAGEQVRDDDYSAAGGEQAVGRGQLDRS